MIAAQDLANLVQQPRLRPDLHVVFSHSVIVPIKMPGYSLFNNMGNEYCFIPPQGAFYSAPIVASTSKLAV